MTAGGMVRARALVAVVATAALVMSCRIGSPPPSATSSPTEIAEAPAESPPSALPSPSVVATAGATETPTTVPSPTPGPMALVSPLDSDGDLWPDELEILIGLDPQDPLDARQDSDRDGLLDAAEEEAGTDLYDDDTDGGGESDGSEVRAGRDPLHPDDDTVPDWRLVAWAIDGARFVARALSEGAPVQVLLLVWSGEEVVTIGTLPGDGTFAAAGPFPPGDYNYIGIAFTDEGATSGWLRSSELSLADDVTPPSTFISVNGGRWDTDEREVTVEFFNLSEPVVEMRLAASEEGLASAAWIPFSEETSLLLPDEPGTYIIHAEVRDAGGLVSQPATGVAAYWP